MQEKLFKKKRFSEQAPTTTGLPLAFSYNSVGSNSSFRVKKGAMLASS